MHFLWFSGGKAPKLENIREGELEYFRRISGLNSETLGHIFWDCRWVRDGAEHDDVCQVFAGVTGEDVWLYDGLRRD